MYKQFAPNSAELNLWLDTVARAAIDVFHVNSTVPLGPSSGNSILSTTDTKEMYEI